MTGSEQQREKDKVAAIMQAKQAAGKQKCNITYQLQGQETNYIP